MIADKAYSSRSFRAYLRRRGIGATIPEKNDQAKHRHNRGRRGVRPPGFDAEAVAIPIIESVDRTGVSIG
ncbi:hypothetical protein [Streptomyces sp. NPDC048357]|uniref:hypothetical protein n=1 Tax=Streptomyces sp. NPDC048357 TaxID=3154719 RepID=UPI00343817CE